VFGGDQPRDHRAIIPADRDQRTGIEDHRRFASG
jgi:hypothetical protein